MDLTLEQWSKIEQTHDAVIRLQQLIEGGNGELCVVGQLKEIKQSLVKYTDDNTDAHMKILKKHHTLERNFWVLIAILGGSGLLGTGLFELLKR